MAKVRILALLVSLVVVAGCGSPAEPPPSGSGATSASTGMSPTEGPTQTKEEACADAAAGIVAGAEEMLAAVIGGAEAAAGATGTPGPEAPGSSPVEPLIEAMERAEEARNRLGCDPAEFDATVREALAAAEPESPIGQAIWPQITALVLGQSAAAPTEVTFNPGEDLAAVVTGAPPGSTIILPAGEITLTEPLTLMNAVTLRGQGMDATTIASSATGAAVTVVGEGRVELSDLALVMRGEGGRVSGVIAGPIATVALTRVRISGARMVEETGGAGVEMYAAGSDWKADGTTLEVTDSLFSENQWAGVLLSGDHRVSIQGTSFTANGTVGIDFRGNSSGTVSNSTFTANEVGALVWDSATPAFSSCTFNGGNLGLKLMDNSAATLDGLQMNDVRSVAVNFADEAKGAITNASCGSAVLGILIENNASPTVGPDNNCRIQRGL